MISLSKTSHGNICIIDLNEQVYHRNKRREKSSTLNWKCRVKDCKAWIKTTIDHKLLGSIAENHSHIGNNILKRKAKEKEGRIIKRMAPMPGVPLQSVITEISSTLEV